MVRFCGLNISERAGCGAVGISNLVLNLTNFIGFLVMTIKGYDHVTWAVAISTGIGFLINFSLCWGLMKRNPHQLIAWTTLTAMTSLLNSVLGVVVIYKKVSVAWGSVVIAASVVNFVAVSFVQSVVYEMMRASD
ncbi:uncharacterized protein LOC125044499 isoform X1 [Penaeus chinensis]|uniref:uncharacterized protein LOC125044499 isoform X1 n=1 Tax=Penaeus chinensis TaxID=139456 RepID=UPI001FB57C69|nr:uncharacterized protein LOC125044499 isoform X1 [Penaeus chinensis]